MGPDVSADSRRDALDLVKAFCIAAAHYAWAVNEAKRQRPELSIGDYQRLYASLVVPAREDCAHAREQLSTSPLGCADSRFVLDVFQTDPPPKYHT